VYLVFVFKSREKVKTIAALQLELCQLLPNSSIVKKIFFSWVLDYINELFLIILKVLLSLLVI